MLIVPLVLPNSLQGKGKQLQQQQQTERTHYIISVKVFLFENES